MSDRMCPYCANGTTIRHLPLCRNDELEIKIKNVDNREIVYVETLGKIVELDKFYFCPFCGRPLKGRYLGTRKFRGE